MDFFYFYFVYDKIRETQRNIIPTPLNTAKKTRHPIFGVPYFQYREWINSLI